MKTKTKSKATPKTKSKAEAPLPLAVPETVNPGLVNMAVPKLSKNELLTALVERARIKHEEESAAARLLVDQTSERLKQAVLEHFRSSPPDDFDAFPREYDCSVVFVPKSIPPHLTLLQEEDRAACRKTPGIFIEGLTRRKIKAAMDGSLPSSQRIQAVLGNTEAIKTLDAALDALMSPDVKTLDA